VTGSLCLSQASSGIKAGYTLDRVPTHRRAYTLSFTHAITTLQTFRDANQPTVHVFGPGEETPEARGEHTNSTHTAEDGMEPPTLEAMTDEHREQTAIFALKLSYRLMRLASIHES
ncbi:hypothetical protein QTP70_016646, partial [Hemibagrus guttatus]